jgi:transcriptional regulator NrdR family protein
MTSGLFFNPHKAATFPLAFLIAVCQYIAMVCIYCGAKTKVNNSRLQSRSNHIWRRRECLACHSIFTSLEGAELKSAVMVRSANGRLKPFMRDQLFISLYESSKHRPKAVQAASYLTDTVLSKLVAGQKDAVLDRDEIVRTTHEVLKRFDRTAATIYLAYHPLP